jgi:hypothetical protein
MAIKEDCTGHTETPAVFPVYASSLDGEINAWAVLGSFSGFCYSKGLPERETRILAAELNEKMISVAKMSHRREKMRA